MYCGPNSGFTKQNIDQPEDEVKKTQTLNCTFFDMALTSDDDFSSLEIGGENI
jgi:hypothetical protein